MGIEAALIGGGAMLGGALLGADASKDAAQMQSDQNYLAMQEQRRQYDLTRQDLSPFLQAATGQGGALNRLIAGIDQAPGIPTIGQFQFDPRQALQNPALQFQMEQGQQQMDRVAGKNRLLGSGQRLIEAQKFGQGLASQGIADEYQRQLGMSQENTNRLMQQYGLQSNDYNQRLNRLAGIVDVGRGTGSALGAMGGQTAGNISNLMQNTGQAQAQGRIGQANAYSNMLGQGAMLYGMSGGFGGGGGWQSGSTAGGYGGTGMTSSWR